MLRMKHRWQKFKFKAPRFHDPAEAFFEVKLTSGSIVKDCYWGATTFTCATITLEHPGFHVDIDGASVLIHPISITHYRRQ